MKIDMAEQRRKEAIASMRQYFDENMPEPLNELRAGLLLDYLVEEIGPAIYNKAIEEAQERMLLRATDLSSELYADEFPYWIRQKTRRPR